MQELHLVGFTTDLEQLIFSVRKGAKSGGYTVGLDEQLLTVIAEAVRMRRAVGADVSEAAAAVEAAVREGNAASAAKAESALTPREIQARLRSGRSVKQVAKAAGVSEAWIERFAAPVRAEQGQMAQRARALVFSKPRLGESAEPLGMSVRWNVAEKGVRFTEHEFDERWSAYQFQDHVWVIRFAFESRKREHVAEWVLDLETSELTHRNRLASDLGYLEPGKRRKIADLVPEPADVPVETSRDADDDEDTGRRPSRGSGRPGKRPAKKSTAKRTTAKKATAKRATAKKAAAKRSTAKKATAKKSTAKRSTAKKATAKKSTAKRSTAKKSRPKKAAAKKSAAKRTTAKRSTATKKSGPKKSVAKKAAAKKAAAKKATAKKAAARKTPASRPPAAAPAEPAGSPWQAFSAGATGPAAPPPAPRRPQTLGQGERSPRVDDRTARRAARRGHVANPDAPPGPAATSERPEQEQAAAPPPLSDPEAAEIRSDTGQVVTIRANRATPPVAERRDPARRAPSDADEGMVADPTPLRPALQARPPRRRRYGNRS